MKTRSLTMLLVGTLLLAPLSAQSTQPTPPMQPSLSTLQNDLPENYTPRKGWPKADKKFYLDIRGGYGFQMGGGYNGFLRYDDDRLCFASYIGRNKQIRTSMSEGWQGSLNFGYRLNRYMAIEFGVGYTKTTFGITYAKLYGHITIQSTTKIQTPMPPLAHRRFYLFVFAKITMICFNIIISQKSIIPTSHVKTVPTAYIQIEFLVGCGPIPTKAVLRLWCRHRMFAIKPKRSWFIVRMAVWLTKRILTEIVAIFKASQARDCIWCY